MHAQPWKKTYQELGIPEEINPDAYSSVAEL